MAVVKTETFITDLINNLDKYNNYSFDEIYRKIFELTKNPNGYLFLSSAYERGLQKIDQESNEEKRKMMLDVLNSCFMYPLRAGKITKRNI